MLPLTKRIRALRLSCQYSQEYMAIKMEISQTAYSYLESKEDDKLTIGELRKIASIVNVSFFALITDNTNCETRSAVQPGTNTAVLNYIQKIKKEGVTKNSISTTIRKFREVQEITQQRMADNIGVSLKTYRLVENQPDDFFRLGKVKQIAAVLSIPDWTLFLPEFDCEFA